MSTPDTFTQLLQEELTPRPDEEFAAEMDQWVADGFPPRDGRQPKRRRPSLPVGSWLDRAVRVTRSPLGLAGMGTAVAAVIIAVVLAADTAERGTTAPEQSAAGDAAAEPMPTALEETPTDLSRSDDQGGRAAAPPSPGGIAPRERDRRIEQSATMTLASPADDFQSTADEILKVTDRHQGFVLQSNVTTGDQPSGDFQLRIPADRLQAALRDLAALGDVRARSDSGRDVTKEYVSVTDSFADARAERKALLRRLRAADGETEIQRIRAALDRNAQERAGLRGQIRDLRERTDYAAVTVTLIEKEGGSDDGDDGGAGIGGSTDDALDDSLGLLVGSFNWLLRALGALIPAGLLLGAAWWAARTFRRRRREAVLF